MESGRESEVHGTALLQVPEQQSQMSSTSYPFNATDSALSSFDKPSENKTNRMRTDEGRGEMQRRSVKRLQKLDDSEKKKAQAGQFKKASPRKSISGWHEIELQSAQRHAS